MITFKSVYDGLLQIARVILLINGYVPDDGEQHKTTFAVTSMILGNDFDNLIGIIDNYRVRRNQCIYQPLDNISKQEAMGIIEVSEKFWRKVRIYLHEKSPQLQLFDY